MPKQTTSKEDLTGTSDEIPFDSTDQAKPLPDAASKRKRIPIKKSSVAQIDAMERSAVGAVEAHSAKDVSGGSGLANTGTIISYDQ